MEESKSTPCLAKRPIRLKDRSNSSLQQLDARDELDSPTDAIYSLSRNAPLVVIGGGIAGVTCAQELGRLNPDRQIILVSSSDTLKDVSTLY